MTFTAARIMLRAMPGAAVMGESRAQSRSADRAARTRPVQREVVRTRVGLPVHGCDGPDDVLGQPQKDERQHGDFQQVRTAGLWTEARDFSLLHRMWRTGLQGPNLAPL